MSLKSILCAYSGDPEKGGGLRYAINLAKHHDAHLTGVAKTGGLGFLHRQLPAQLPESIRAQLDANGREVMANTAKRFRDMVAEAGLSDRSEFVELDPKTDGPIASFARAFDLSVIGHYPGAPYEDDYAAHPDLIALRSGRPVLIVPQDAVEPDHSTRNITIAWDGKRAATRALVAALPLFDPEAQVTLLSIGKTPRNTERFLETLARHNVQSNAETVWQDGTIADTLLTKARSSGADLLVMGAFEHSKFSHDIIGGATTDVLAIADVPVLMAH
ncbi:universal stress protein [Gymnodinialimonas hymeniacidonis]|uniref:universal stress protein n=1 Tax=Gymnodinialimonas hymeniacidonis TaxID=3126508 RepID=UPI0034C5EFA8